MRISGDLHHLCDSPILIVAAAVVIRLFYVLSRNGRPLRSPSPRRLSTLIVLGSGGGHTAEMLSIVDALQNDRFMPRFYVTAMTDNMSLQKAQVLEESLIQQHEINDRKVIGTAQFVQNYRSREVGQSYLTSVGTTLIAMLHALWLIVKLRPQVVAGIRWSSIFYVESIARVRKLSLSGLLLYKLRLADQFVVQWPQLQKKYPRAHYVGRLM